MGNSLLATQALNSNMSPGVPYQKPAFANTAGVPTGGSLFNNSGNDYSQDLMMPECLRNCNNYSAAAISGGLFNANPTNSVQTGAQVQQPSAQVQSQPQAQPQMTAQSQNQPQMPAQPQSAPTFSGNREQYYNILNQDTEKPKSGRTGKKTGVILGILTPLAMGVYKMAKGAKPSQAFPLKSL